MLVRCVDTVVAAQGMQRDQQQAGVAGCERRQENNHSGQFETTPANLKAANACCTSLQRPL
jgi:hypothetical protein